MKNSFSEIKLFQVRPDRLEQFEQKIAIISELQKKRDGCLDIKYMKRFFLIQKDGLPRELTRIVKCVKYFSYWQFTDKDSYGKANQWYFEDHAKDVMKLLIMPFDINCGYDV